MRILRLSAFKDNFIWVLVNEQQEAVIVDPGDATPVIKELEASSLTPVAMLITHHHADHTGGIVPLLERYPIPVYGPKNPNINGISQVVSEGDQVRLGRGFPDFEVIECPGHTLDHIAFYAAPYLFCGDTLFAGGCGRMFEGSPKQFTESLAKLGALPSTTQVFCAHEYTTANLRFALQVEPQNQALLERARTVQSMREYALATVPSLLVTELATNPFLRTQVASVQQAASQFIGAELTDQTEVFAAIRKWKDSA
ncbi:MAG: hydroxyacylglutathione hydrolase [Idiomarinaceae bacterium HL-53]|nr:MAG: hydroxyacylglutathione hydrolase [Idiomarinaceae bacterium HL-53]CUS48679.1 hydroxyacylglutathione hydrolase [Idiomarinaceae bacterium HL-53]